MRGKYKETLVLTDDENSVGEIQGNTRKHSFLHRTRTVRGKYKETLVLTEDENSVGEIQGNTRSYRRRDMILSEDCYLRGCVSKQNRHCL